MNAARVIHGIAAFMFLGMASVMLREFGMSYKYGLLGEAFREIQGSLPWLSSFVLPAAPCAWWCAFTPLFCAIGIAMRVPADSQILLAIHWLTFVIIAEVIVLGAFLPYVKATSLMGYIVPTDPTAPQIAVNGMLLAAAGMWMVRGIIQARRGP